MKKSRIDRRMFCKTGALAASVAAFKNAQSHELPFSIFPSKTKKKPNVLLIFTDQQSRMAMSAIGNPHLYTPNMDSIAGNGVLFNRSYCTTPVCGPSRSSWMTGLMPHQTGVNYNGDTIKEGIPTMGFIFREAGYDTGWSGKWHLPESYPAIPKPWREDDKLGSIPGFEMLPIKGDPRKMYPFGDFADDPVADSAIEFIERERDKPFLLGVSLHNPHDICHQVMDKLIEEHPSYRKQEPDDYSEYPPLPPNFCRDPNEPEFISICRKREIYGPENTYTTDWDETRWRIYLYEYYRMTERVDRIIGRVLDTIRKNNLEEDTIILFTADHGEGMAAHEWVVKLMLYEEVIAVPFALQWKNVIPSGIVDHRHLVSGMDILPTICEYADVALPEPVTGHSLRTVIDHPQEIQRDFIVTELASDKNDHSMLGRMIRTNRFKYIVFSKGEHPEMFFDRMNDPGEVNNLIQNPEFQSQIKEHRSMLKKWMQETNDSFVFPA